MEESQAKEKDGAEKRLGDNDELAGHFLSLGVHRKRKNRKACPWGLLPKAMHATTHLQKLLCARGSAQGSSKLPRSITSQ